MGGPLLVLRVFVCVCLPALFFNYCSFQVTTFQRAEKHEGRRGPSRRCTQPEGKHFLAHQPLEDHHCRIRFDAPHAFRIG